MATSQRAVGRNKAVVPSDSIGPATLASASRTSSHVSRGAKRIPRDVQQGAAPTHVDSSSPSQQRYESEAHKEQLRQQVRETIARIQKLTQEHHAVATRSDGVRRLREGDAASSPAGRRSREATPEYDPDNPFDDRTMTDQARAAAERATRAAAALPAARTAKAAQPMRRPSPLNKSPSEGDILHKGDSKAAAATQISRTSVPSSSRTALTGNIGPASTVPVRQRVSLTADAPACSASAAFTSLEQSTRAGSQERADRRERAGRQDRTSPVRAADEASKAAASYRSRTSEASSIRQSPPKPQRNTHNDRNAKPVAPRRSLSDEASTTLASLDATLARLKSLSPGQSRAKSAEAGTVRRDSGEGKGIGRSARGHSDRMRRSLSPSKEMYEMDKLRSKSAAEEPALPRQTKSSFLARVEQTRQTSPERTRESATSKLLTQHRDASSSTEETSRAEVQTQTQSKPVVRRRNIYAYTPPKCVDKEQQCYAVDTSNGPEGSSLNGAGSTSASSIVIGDESVDDLLRSHGTDDDGRMRQFLQGFSVLVDVRDQDGEDASTVWSDKLRSVGAKVYTKPPQPARRRSSGGQNAKLMGVSDSAVAPPLDYIVYKHGKPATLHYYRAQIDAGREPIIVGVNWILDCLRKGERVDARDFLVEVGKQTVFAKRRTSMTPKRAPAQAASSSSDAMTSQGPGISELLARKKLIQNAPGKPSPLATRCWNMNASTSSTMSTVTANHTQTITSVSANVSTPSFS